MRCIPSLLILPFLIVGFACEQALQEEEATSPLRVMSYNIRYNNPGDGEHAWPHRAGRVASTILFNNADLIGVQEALKEQMDTLLTLLPGYKWIGVGRDDGQEAGEYSAIFYKSDRFEIIDSGTFWLSKNPSIPGSKDWDAALTRIATWGHFKDIQADTSIFHFNTHFDHRGEEAREKSAALIAQRATREAGQYPLVVTGDFNFTESATGYSALTSKLTDTFYATTTPRHGPDDTIYGGFEVTHEPGRRIDYIFVNEHLEVLQYANLSDNWNGAYSSDHLAVISTIQIK
ncbi:MAG: endonuclease/exonuclease/phosphatase family protein [Rhodothermales bacterium]